MSVLSAMQDACAAVGIHPPRHTIPGQWVKCPAVGKSPANGSGRVLIFDDGKGGIAWNWITGSEQRFSEHGTGEAANIRPPRRDPEAERREAQERTEVARICQGIVKAAKASHHPYLAAKGFPTEEGLVVENLRALIPDHDLGRQIALRLPDGPGPWLIIPGRIAQQVVTVQIIGPDGTKKNVYRGQIKGAAHRIAAGRETWVCEGIATAYSVRAALKLLGRSATVISAFSANNVAEVAKRLPGSFIAADRDKPLEQLGNIGTGEFYARVTGHVWSQPPELGDFNDMHMSVGLRSVALHLREVGMR